MKDEFIVKRKCMNCDCDYTHDIGAKHSKDLKEYINFLGCCKEKCYKDLPRKKRNKLMFGAFVSQFSN
tara:strand:- start:241 stop:444 length:204 start_codon:yes stop_codon:yes gene_type:complete